MRGAVALGGNRGRCGGAEGRRCQKAKECGRARTRLNQILDSTLLTKSATIIILVFFLKREEKKPPSKCLSNYRAEIDDRRSHLDDSLPTT